jgi:hypothetical protein
VKDAILDFILEFIPIPNLKSIDLAWKREYCPT